MPADRLTAETARVGMRVRCVDAQSVSCDSGQLREGEIYTVKGPRGDTGDIWLEGVYSSWEPSRFIPADPEPAPEEPPPGMLDRSVAFALNVKIGAEYGWTQYMRDLWHHQMAASPLRAGS